MGKENGKRRARGRAAFAVFAALYGIILFSVLELGKHTVAGWILAAAALGGFVLLRIKVLEGKKAGIRLLGWAGLFAVSALILAVSWPPVRNVPAVSGKSAGKTGVVHTAAGDVSGVLSEDGKVEVYAGIPYAEPPVGDLRWREPVPKTPWEGVLEADSFAPMSMQTRNLPIYYSLAQIIGYHDYRISLSDNYREPVSEDSLYLNVWKPAGGAESLPVLVYIHGGSLQTGQPWYADYSGESLARDGIVVVNMGYRLGIFGFFADPGLAAESSHGTTGNYGLLDQIAALEWVRDNIAAFGGDPSNVTLAGESAGSACVSALCTSPLAKGLFRRAVCESSTVTAPEPAHSFRLSAEAYAAAEKTKERFGAADAEALRAVPAADLAPEMNYHHHITVDGYVLPQTPWEAYEKGIHNEEARMHGFNRYESAPFLLFDRTTAANYPDRVRAWFGADAAKKVLELYPATDSAAAASAWADIYSAALFTYGHYCWDRQGTGCGIPSYTYYFTKNNGRLGAWHSGEEVYLYGNIPDDSNLYTGADRELSAMMKSYFINFISGGDPNGEGLPVWEESSAGGRLFEFGERTGMTAYPFADLHAILDEMYGTGPENGKG